MYARRNILVCLVKEADAQHTAQRCDSGYRRGPLTGKLMNMERRKSYQRGQSMGECAVNTVYSG